MDEQEIINRVRQFIIENGENLITATVLRPILIDIVRQANGVIGDLNSLQTGQSNNIVAAINELVSEMPDIDLTATVTAHVGSNDPNVRPPQNYKAGDVYRRLSGGRDSAVFLYNGQTWVEIVPGINEVEFLQQVRREIENEVASKTKRLNLKKLRNAGRYDLQPEDEYLACWNTEFMWVQMPNLAFSEAGRKVSIRRVQPGDVSIRSSTNRIVTETETGDLGIKRGDVWELVWDGHYWLANTMLR